MNLSPTDREKVLEMVAAGIIEEIRKTVDLPDLISVPVSFVSQITGLSRSQVERTFKIRPMGKRRNGVSLRELMDYQAKQSGA